MSTKEATEAQLIGLANVIGWLRVAKETLPTINEGVIAPDRIAQASALLDRMHRIASVLQEQATPNDRRRAA